MCNLKGHAKYDLPSVINQPHRWPKGVRIHPNVCIHLTDTYAQDRLGEAVSIIQEKDVLKSLYGLIEIPGEKLSLTIKKGMSGSYGDVHKYAWKQSSGVVVDVAVKTWTGGKEASHRRLLREIATLHPIDHPHIVKLLGYTHIHGILGMVLEWIPHSFDQATLPAGCNIFTFALDILQALHCLHKRGIAHRDIKPANVLIKQIDGIPRAVLCDFGVCSDELGEAEMMQTDVGTSTYKCPLVRGRKYTKKVDFFSWARTIYDTLRDHTSQTIYTSIPLITYNQLKIFLMSVWEDPCSFKLVELEENIRSLAPTSLMPATELSSLFRQLTLGPPHTSSNLNNKPSAGKSTYASSAAAAAAPADMWPTESPMSATNAIGNQLCLMGAAVKPSADKAPPQAMRAAPSFSQRDNFTKTKPHKKPVVGYVTMLSAKTYHRKEGCYNAWQAIHSVDNYKPCGICLADLFRGWVTSESASTYHTTYGCYKAKIKISQAGGRSRCKVCGNN